MLCAIFGLIELGLAIYGGYMLYQQVQVWRGEFWQWWDDWWDERDRRRRQRWQERQRRTQPPPQWEPYSQPAPRARTFESYPSADYSSDGPGYGYGAAADGSAVTAVSEPEPEPEYKPRRAYEPTPKTNEADGFETQPYETTWQAGSLSIAEMTEAIMILEADDGKTFTVDDAALPDSLQELQKLGYDVEVGRIPDSDPPQYKLYVHRPRKPH